MAQSVQPLSTHAQLLPQLFTSLASHAGRKAQNQDTLAVQTLSPTQNGTLSDADPWLVTAIADGVSSCQLPKQASEWVIKTLLEQLSLHQANTFNDKAVASYSTSNRSERLAQAISHSIRIINDFLYFNDDQANRALMSQSSYLPVRLSTLTGLLFTDQVSMLFHTGDSRIYRLRHQALTVLTQDHRHHHGRDKGALSAALGADVTIELQLTEVDVLPDDVFLLMTDGVYEFIGDDELLLLTQSAMGKLLDVHSVSTIELQQLPETLCQVALENGSQDNVSCVLIAVKSKTLGLTNPTDKTANMDSVDNLISIANTPLQIPPVLSMGDKLDNFTIDKVIKNTPRSTIYLATDNTADTGDNQRILKVPSAYYDDDEQYLRLFLKEEKIGLSFNHPSLLKFYPKPPNSHYLYHVTEYVQGISLREFIDTQPLLSVSQVFEFVSQIGLALRVLHRNYLLHQDIKPENIMLMPSGHIKLIDFGSVGSMLLKTAHTPPAGDLHYVAPEYFSDAPKGVYSDIFSLGVVTYEMLTGKQAFDMESIATAHTTQKLPFKNVRQWRAELPFWVNDVLIRAMQPDSDRRYQAIGDFLTDLDPKSHNSSQRNQPLIEKNPVLFWQLVSGVLFMLLVLVLLFIAVNH